MPLTLSRLPLRLSWAFCVLLFGCSSDDGGGGEGDGPCVTVGIYRNNQLQSETECAPYPAACLDNEDSCGEPGDECSAALQALCEDGTERQTCVATRLNGKVTAVDITCTELAQPHD